MAPKSRGRQNHKRTPQKRSPLTKQELHDLDVHAHNVTYRSGPIPTPEELAAYNSVNPNFAERIFTMAEKQQRASNRNKFLENISVAIFTFSGQLFSLSALAGILYLIYYAITEDNATAIKWLAGTTAGIIGVFIYKRRRIKTPQ